MQKAYKYSILYFLLFSLLLLASSILLFEEKIGFSVAGVLDYYLGNEEKFITAKSTTGVLKIILPHIFLFGLFVMVVLHFLIFTKHKHTKKMRLLIYASFLIAFSELFSPFFILYGFEFFAYVKLLSFMLFEFLFLYLFWLLFESIIFST